MVIVDLEMIYEFPNLFDNSVCYCVALEFNVLYLIINTDNQSCYSSFSQLNRVNSHGKLET